MPDVYIPKCVLINITSRITPLIAVCEGSYKSKYDEE